MKPFDEKFGENVREAFDNYQEPVDERAWKQMKSRLKARSKKGIFVMTPFFTTPLFMRAAAVIIFLIAASGSLWLLVLNQQKTDMATAYEVHEDTPGTPDEGSGDTPKAPADRTGDISSPLADRTGDISSIIPGQEEIITAVSPGDDDSTDQAGEGQPSVPASISERLATEALEIQETRTVPNAPEMPGTTPVPDARQLAETTPPPFATELPPLSAINGIYSKGVTSYLVTSEQLADGADAFIIARNLESLGEAETRKDRTSIMEVSAGSMKTWSPREIAGGLGYTAGVGGDWRVGRRISIHGGGLLVYNRFSLENTLVSAKHYSDQELAAAPERDISLVYNVLQYQTSETDVEFTALDIPVNIRFTLKEASGSRIFLSAGFSSFLYLQQKYSSESTVLASYHRMTPQGHYMSETGYASLTSGGEFSAFRRFDFARFLNLSGGYVIRGRNQSLIIEPFLKYSLGDVTTLNLNIGMAGLSLKYLPGSR